MIKINPDINALTGKALYYVFFIALIIAFSPFKIVAYAIPYILVLVFLIIHPLKSVFEKAVVFMFVSFSYIVLWKFLSADYMIFSGFLSLLTLSSYLIFFTVPSRYFFYVKGESLNKAFILILLIQIVVAIFQFVYGVSQTGTIDGSTGDFIEGTIDLPLASSRSFSNPMFAVAMASVTIAIIPTLSKNLMMKVLIFCCFSVIIICSVMHVTIFLLISIIISYFIVYGFSILTLRNISLLLFIIIAIVAVNLLMPKNVGNISESYEVISNLEGYKQLAYIHAWKEVDNILGFGPGQLASKAAFISSGFMHGGSISIFNAENMSREFSLIMSPLWQQMNLEFISPGSSQTPFSSWLSILSEFGILAVFVCIYAVYKMIKAKSYIKKGKEIYAFSFFTLGVFIFLIGFQDMYWETPQIMTLVILLMKYLWFEGDMNESRSI